MKHKSWDKQIETFSFINTFVLKQKYSKIQDWNHPLKIEIDS